jgi:hypothetical protein
MTRIRANIPDEFQFRQNDTPAIRAQKLEILRKWVSDQIELLSNPDPTDPPTGPFNIIALIDCSPNPPYPAASQGDVYIVSVAGRIGGGAGPQVDVGDTIICMTNNVGGTQAAVGADWFILEHNLVGALLAANNLSDVANAATARANLLAAPLFVPVTFEGAAYQFALTDVYSHVSFTNAGPIAATVPKNATVAFPVGTRIRFSSDGAGQVTLTPQDGTVLLRSADGALKSRVQYSVGEITKLATNTWAVLGDVTT